MSYLRESIGNLMHKAERTITGTPESEPTPITSDNEESQAKAFILGRIQTLKTADLNAYVKEILQSMEQIISGQPYHATSLWIRQKNEQDRILAEANEERAKLQAWKQFCKDHGALQLGKYRLQLSTNRSDIMLEFDENVIGLVRGRMPATQIDTEGKVVQDGRTAETRISWNFGYLLNIVEQTLVKDPSAGHVDFDWQLGFPVRQEPTIVSSSTLLSAVVQLRFLFKLAGGE